MGRDYAAAKDAEVGEKESGAIESARRKIGMWERFLIAIT